MGARWPFPAAFVLALAALIAAHLPRREASSPASFPPPLVAKPMILSASIAKRVHIGQKMPVDFTLRYEGPGDAWVKSGQCSEATIPSGFRIEADGKRRPVARRLSSASMGRLSFGSGFSRIPTGHSCQWEQDLNHLFIIDVPGRYVFTTETGPAFRQIPFYWHGTFPAIAGSTITLNVVPADNEENLRRMDRFKFEFKPEPMGGFSGLDDLVELQDERAIPMVLDLLNDPKLSGRSFEALSGFCDRRHMSDGIVEDFRQRRRARKHVELGKNAEVLAMLEVWPCRDLDKFRDDKRGPEIATAKKRWLKTLGRLSEAKD